MRINQARDILRKRTEELNVQISRLMEATGKTREEVVTADPFLAGKVYMMSSIAIDWIVQDDTL